MGSFDSFFTTADVDAPGAVEWQTKAVGCAGKLHRPGDRVALHPWDEHLDDGPAREPADVQDFAVAGLAGGSGGTWGWVVCRDGLFLGVADETKPPPGLPLFDNFGRPTVAGVSLGRRSTLPDPRWQ